jgi:hypothetical protein
MAVSPPPKPIDPRGPRTNQSVLAVALLVAFVVDWRPVAPLFALVLFLGAAFGPRYGPILRLYSAVVKPRLGPPRELEDPRPPRFAAAVGVVFLAAASASFAFGHPGLGWGLSLIVAALAGLAATTGLCVGCEVYLWLSRLRAHARGVARVEARIPAELLSDGAGSWIVFTTPYCASCGPVADMLRAADDGAGVVMVDTTRHPDLAAAFRVHRSPTVVRADAAGAVDLRLVGPEAVRDYLSGRVATASSAAV